MILTLDDFEAAARRRLPACLFGFAANGSERGASVRGNARSFERWAFVPDTLLDVSSISQECHVFDKTYASPFGIAPMGACSLFAHQADLALARAAHASRLPFILSAASSVPLEQVMSEAPGTWYQGYVSADEDTIDGLLRRLDSAKVEVLVLTVDVPVASNRDADRRLGFSVPLRPGIGLVLDGLLHPRWLVDTFARTILTSGIPRLPNFTGQAEGRSIISAPTAGARSNRDRFTWEHVASIRRRWRGRLVLKGILSPGDARKAVERGADGLIVSNHGGRQLDGAIAPLDALPDVLEASGAVPVMLDGGIRRGTDAMKALALGAQMVFVGRPMLYAVATAGQAGAQAAIDILQRELTSSLALVGCTRLSELSRGRLRAITAPAIA